MIDCSLVMTVFFTMTVGLLFIDLVSLQENMVCSGEYNNTNNCPESFFAQSYTAARARFREAAKKAKAEMKRHLIVEEDGFDYTIDTAFLPGKNSKRLLVHISGIGGVDGYTGSALQLKLLREWNSSREEGPSVLFVHAVNPYGMAHFRRNNENNVYLDFNYHSPEEWKNVLMRDPNATLYSHAVSPLLPSRSPRFIDRYIFFFHLLKVFLTRGLRTFTQAFAAGQHHHPEGVGFGGYEEQRGVKILREIIAEHTAASIEKFVVLDVRSDHGWEGAETIVTNLPEDKTLTQSIFTAPVVVSEGGGGALSRDWMKSTDISRKTGLVVREEFGTISYIFVVRAVFLENAAYNYARGTYVHSVMQEWLRDALYPQTIKYKRTVLTKGVNAFNSAWKYLT